MEILFEDKNILAINKSAGLIVHPDGKIEEDSVSSWFVKEYPEAEGVGEAIELKDGSVIERHGIVHRLDKETSGVMLLAKTQEGFWSLKKQFKKRLIKKTYHTFIYGNIKEDRGVFDKEIGREKGGIRRWAVGKFARGELREAITNYKVLYRGKDNDETYCFLEVSPKTGRTHQIRVHMKAAQHPIVKDKLYAPNRSGILGFNRLALHARKITFKDLDGESVTVEAPYPDDFNDALLKAK